MPLTLTLATTAASSASSALASPPPPFLCSRVPASCHLLRVAHG